VELEVQNRTLELSKEIAEHKKDEESLQKLNENLKMTVDKLTTASRELEQFAFITSHHLREPVRKISAFGRILASSLADKLNDDQNENLNFMIDGANKIGLMVKGLKLYLESSVEKIEFEDIDLNLIIKQIERYEAAEILTRTNGAIRIPEKLPIVRGSPVRIHQVLQQVITNGLEYHKDNIPPEIVVRAYKEKESMVCIEIEDNGIGIKQAYLNDMFNPFKRLCSERNCEGIGIGLAISKKVIERHGGQIGVKSIYRQGTIIWFTLPLAGDGIESEFAAASNSTYNTNIQG
jgi:light-regulated signal transduction histidine kinase (bacteriophytochrome)